LVRGGKSENEATAIAERAAKIAGSRPERDTPMDKDSVMMQPVENWEASDKRPPGRRRFLFPSPRYKERYDEIDWSE
jgi:hypothetical protein